MPTGSPWLVKDTDRSVVVCSCKLTTALLPVSWIITPPRLGWGLEEQWG